MVSPPIGNSTQFCLYLSFLTCWIGSLFLTIDSPLQFHSALFLSCQLSPVKRLRRVKDKRSAVNTGSLLLSPTFLYLLTAIWKQTVSLVIKDKREAVRTRQCCIYYFIFFVINCMLHMFEYCVCRFCCCLLRRWRVHCFFSCLWCKCIVSEYSWIFSLHLQDWLLWWRQNLQRLVGLQFAQRRSRLQLSAA